MPNELFQECKTQIEFNSQNQDYLQVQSFLDNLPQTLSIKMTMHIHEQRYERITFTKDKSKSFISWLCPLMKPIPYNQKQYIFQEQDDVSNIYFLIKGTASFVLPLYDDAKYVNINVGDHFGVIDIIGSQPKELDIDLVNWVLNDWLFYKTRIRRQFTVMACQQVEVLAVSIHDLQKMKTEFYDCYYQLLTQALDILRICIVKKLKSMRECRQQSRR